MCEKHRKIFQYHSGGYDHEKKENSKTNSCKFCNASLSYNSRMDTQEFLVRKQRKEGFCSDIIILSEQRSFSYDRTNATIKSVKNAEKYFNINQVDMTMKKRKK